jgi:tetratricopeptide (TPR) repeat protein
VRLLRSIADKEEGEAESSQGIPAHEMIGDMLLDMSKPEDALAEYQTALKNDPGRFNSLYGAARAAELAGKHDKASEYYSQVVKNCEGSKSARVELQHAREAVEARAKSVPQARSLFPLSVSPTNRIHSGTP